VGPTKSSFTSAERLLPCNVQIRVSSLLNFPLNLISLVLHEIFPDARNYCFTSDDDEGQDSDDDEGQDSGLLQYFSYKLEHTSASQLLVIYQSPQVLSDKDIEMFVKCRTFPPYRHMGYAFPEKLDSEHRLWGKIWDLCAKQHTRWFVLTSYNFWVFGAFSEGWTTAFVSNAVRCDSKRPSVATFLLFWLASAIHRDGAAQVPKVPEPTNNRFTPVSIPVLGHDNFINAADSESHWDGKSDDFTSFTSVQLSDTGSYASNHTTGGDTSYRNSLRAPLLAGWLNNTQFQYAPATIGLEPQESIQRIDRSPQNTSFSLGEWLI